MDHNKTVIEVKAISADEADLLIFGEIGESWFDEDTVTAKKVKLELDAAGDIKRLNVHIQSAGGNFWDGLAIYNMLDLHAAYKTVYIVGLAASAAHVIAMAGNKIVMPANSYMMAHRSRAGIWSNAEEHRKLADLLDRVDASMVNIYTKRTGLDAETVIDQMKEDFWMTAEEAVGFGYADEIAEEVKVAAKADLSTLSQLNNVPEALLKSLERSDAPDEKERRENIAANARQLHERVAQTLKF